jgi:hypothetical protein
MQDKRRQNHQKVNHKTYRLFLLAALGSAAIPSLEAFLRGRFESMVQHHGLKVQFGSLGITVELAEKPVSCCNFSISPGKLENSKM